VTPPVPPPDPGIAMNVPEPWLSTLVIGFDGPVLPPAVAALLARGLGGVALFARNLVDAGQVRDLNRAIRSAARGLPPPIVSVDQEGGRVQRLRRLCPLRPAAAELGALGPDACREAGREVGRDLADLGFNLDFAPVLDVDTNPSNPIIGDRAFGRDPSTAAAGANAFREGLESAGIAGCGKHFPGHGDAALDSHLDLPVIDLPADRLWSLEAAPFAAAVDAGIRVIMTAHCLYPALDPEVPATLSPVIVDGWLRGRLGFDGCIVTDDLGMKAIADRFTPPEVLRRGLAAGVDLFLHCGAKGEGLELAGAMERGLADGSLPADRVAAAAGRVLRLRAALS
jgi:beta-N-acetylhexosaminidase